MLNIKIFQRFRSKLQIATAVRTPPSTKSSLESSATQLCFAIEQAIKQAAIPRELIQKQFLFMGNGVAEEARPNMPNSTESTESSGFKAIMMAAESLQGGHAEVVVAGGIESMSKVPLDVNSKCKDTDTTHSISRQELDEYMKVSYKRTTEAIAAGVFFEDEVIPVRIQSNRKRREDEDFMKSPKLNTVSGGAAALVLTTEATATLLQLRPLARIIAYEDAATGPNDLASLVLAVTLALEKALICPTKISIWQVHAFPIVALAFMKQFGIDPAIWNIHGSSFVLGHASGANLVTRLVHSLAPDQLGCAAICDGAGSASAMLIEKINNNQMTGGLPMLTLYTKDPCPLCDNLVDELQSHFAGEYQLEKVYIDQQENVGYLRLFRHDIPVLFLNGQFVCMHKLNVKLLERKLAQIKRQPGN